MLPHRPAMAPVALPYSQGSAMLPHGAALFPHGPAAAPIALPCSHTALPRSHTDLPCSHTALPSLPHSPVLPWSLAAAPTHLRDQPPPPTRLPLLPATCCVSTSPCGHSSAARPGCENCHNGSFSQPNCSTDELALFSVGQQIHDQQLPPDPGHAARGDLHPKPRQAATTPGNQTPNPGCSREAKG